MTVDNDRNNDNDNDNSMTILKLITIVMRMTVMIFMFFVLLRAWDKKKNILSPHEESNLRPWDPRCDALPLSQRDSTVSKIFS